jgi:phosphohistidine phosphatase
LLLYLLRHGKASRPDPDGPRSLTAGGREEIAKVAGYFKKKGLKLQTLWHSPKTRAIQTSEIFLEVIGEDGVKVKEKRELKPDGDSREVYEELNDVQVESLMLVSHLPFIGELGSLLATDSSGADITFPTGGLVAFERKGKTWKWLWSLDPSTLKG